MADATFEQEAESDYEERSSSINSEPIAKKRKKKECANKWMWKDDRVEALIRYLKDYKTLCEYRGIDFEADLKECYTAVRKSMAASFPGEFGPEILIESPHSIKEMSVDEYGSYKKAHDEQQKQISKGYDRVKQKIKVLRRDYRSAVMKGTRSGSCKIVKEHFELLMEIWGGSPATEMLEHAVDGDSLGNIDIVNDHTQEEDSCQTTGYSSPDADKGKPNDCSTAFLLKRKI